MKILYYLEPFEELGNPLFRMGTVRNHLDAEVRAIRASSLGSVDVTMVCSEAIAAEIYSTGRLPGVRLAVLRQDELRAIYPDYRTAAHHWYNRTYSKRSSRAMGRLIASKLSSLEPDVIICYESNAPFLEEQYPDALLLHNSLGLFSRAPYPETSCLDPFGIGKDSFLVRHADEIRGYQPDAEEVAFVTAVKERFQNALLDGSPVGRDAVRQGFDAVALLPLQVSKYFMYEENLPAHLRLESQLDLTRYVLERLDPRVGLFVTMHGAEAALMTPEVLRDLRAEFPNLIFSEALQKVRWVSQHALPHVDAVITVSSSVGLQSLLWDVPVVTIGRSHVRSISDGTTVEDANRLISVKSRTKKTAELAYLLAHYYPLLDRYHHDSDWYYAFLERSLTRKRRGLDFSFYSRIDTTHRLREAFLEAVRPEQMAKEVKRTASHLLDTSRPNLSEAIRRMDSADVISFDVFDTLITRPLAHHNAVFDIVEHKACTQRTSLRETFATYGGFFELRRRAADTAMDKARHLGSEEISLRSVYEEMCTLTGISDETGRWLERIEIETEQRLHRPRPAGVKLFREAISRGKRIILVSDMYLSRDVITEILTGSGITGYDALYVSSEYNVLKKTGRLFELVRHREGKHQTILHIGDNLTSDVKMAERAGFSAFHLKNISDIYLESPASKSLWTRNAVKKTLGANIHHGIVSRKFYDSSESTVSRFGGSPYRLGYEAGGPIFLAFVQWIVESALRDRVDRLYFLARDGFLVKAIYDLVASGREDLPESTYLLASRRAFSTPALRTSQDILRSLNLKFSPLPLSDFLRHRYGINQEEIDATTLERSGFRSFRDEVSGRRVADISRLTTFLELNAPVILEHARRERTALLQYLRREGLEGGGSRYVVDIGHNASLQDAIGRLLNDTTLGGYYFATFFGAREVAKRGHPVSGFLLNFEDNEASDHPYCRNIGMFEFLFLPAVPSFVRFRETSGDLKPEFVDGDESARFRVIEEVHRGVLDFCRDALELVDGRIELLDISKTDALKLYLSFVTEPTVVDARMLDAVSFVDAFGGNTSRYLIASPRYPSINADNYNDFVRDSWWREGAKALIPAPKSAKRPNASVPSMVGRGAERSDDKRTGSMPSSKSDDVNRSFRQRAIEFIENPRSALSLIGLSPDSAHPPLVGIGTARKTLSPTQRKVRKLIADPARFFLDMDGISHVAGRFESLVDELKRDPSMTPPGSIARKVRKARTNPDKFFLDSDVGQKVRSFAAGRTVEPNSKASVAMRANSKNERID